MKNLYTQLKIQRENGTKSPSNPTVIRKSQAVFYSRKVENGMIWCSWVSLGRHHTAPQTGRLIDSRHRSSHFRGRGSETGYRPTWLPVRASPGVQGTRAAFSASFHLLACSPALSPSAATLAVMVSTQEFWGDTLSVTLSTLLYKHRRNCDQYPPLRSILLHGW